MGATYTRQSSYTDGDVITAAHTNDEFNQLLASFQASTGHTHDGTANEGGAITKLLGNTLTFGAATAGTDITVTFDGESNDGILLWKEDEDYFEFSDDILIASTEKLQFRDTAIYINSSADGQLDLVADTEIQIAATTIDINGAVDISGNLDVGGNLVVTGTTTFNGGTITMGDAATDNVVFGADIDSNIIPDDDDTYDLGSASQQWRNLFIDGTANIDALVADTADINGGSIDGVTLGTNSAITQAVIDNVNINGATIGHTDDTDLITLADGIVTVAGEISVTTLDIGGVNVTASAADINLIDGITNGTVIASKAIITDSNNDISGGRNITISGELDAGSLDVSGDVDIDGTLETDALSIASTAVSATAAELNYNDTGASVGTVVASKTVTVDANKDVASFRNITLTGELDAGSLDISGDADIDGTLEADAITIGGVTLAETISDTVGAMVSGNTETNIAVSYDDADNTLDFVIGTLNQDTTGNAATVTVTDSTANTNFPVVFHNESNGLLDDTGALRYNPSTGELLVPKLTVAGTTTTVDTVTMNAANAIVFEGATADENETTLTIVDPTADRTINLPNQSGTLPVLAAASNTAITSTPEELNILDGATVVVGEINALDLGATAVGTAIASKAVILDSNKDYTGFRNITTTGVVTIGTQLIMPDVTSTKILVADGTSFQEVAISGDVTIANTGAVTIAANAVEGSMLNDNTISGQTALTSGLANDDELLVSDGGTLKRMDVSVLTAVTDDNATALAIALG